MKKPTKENKVKEWLKNWVKNIVKTIKPKQETELPEFIEF